MQMAARECGECSLCCQAVAVEGLQKAAGEWCTHTCPGGCAVYSVRHEECRAFRCSWLQGDFDDDDRPDRLGVVFFTERTPDGELLMTISEASPGAAAASPRVKELIRQTLTRGVSVVLRNREQLAKLTPDGRIVHAKVDAADPLRVRAGKLTIAREADPGEAQPN